MPEFLDLLEKYENWLEKMSAEYGIPVWLAKPMIESEVTEGTCDGCESKPDCPARAYLLARDKPNAEAPANEA